MPKRRDRRTAEAVRDTEPKPVATCEISMKPSFPLLQAETRTKRPLPFHIDRNRRF
jgi:hypothetical protein